jgi:filamentous hemagglutinin family protein
MVKLSPSLTLLVWCAVSTTLMPQGIAAPIEATLDGTGTIVNPNGNQLTITGGTQSGNNLFHSFQQFGLSADQTANFLTQPAIGNIFSRVSGGQASVINGLLQVSGSNANLFLINPAGIVFGQNARLDLPAAFTAVTADGVEFGNQGWLKAIGNNDYANLTSRPTGFAWITATPGLVVNAGDLSVKPNQAVTLAGGSVINTGKINAPAGQITIAAVPGERLVRVQQDGHILSLDLPTAAQTELTSAIPKPIPQQLPELLTGGKAIGATGLEVDANGVARLTKTNTSIVTKAGDAVISGQVSVAATPALPTPAVTNSTTPPAIDISGERIDIREANIDASGITQAGQINIGGDARGIGDRPRAQTVQVDQNSQINANAQVKGDGGKVIVWSDGRTQFAGVATAKGGATSGNGGFVETSGKQTLDVRNARVDASARNGRNGEWLLDPTNINIANTGTITPNTIATALDGGTNVTISTAGAGADAGDITLTNSINQTGGGTAALTLTGRRFNRNNPAQINLSSTGTLTFNINAVNPEGTPPTASIQNALNAIGTVPGARQINLGAGVYIGAPAFALVSINKDVTINGNDRSDTIIFGNGTARNIFVAAGTTVTLNDLGIVNGFTGVGESGAGILNEGNLTLNRTVLSDNVAGLDGGGIDSSATTSRLTATDMALLNNRAGVDGGGLFSGQNTQLTGVGIVGNQAGNSGGGIYNTGNLTLQRFSFENNTALRGGGLANVGVGSSGAGTLTATVTADNFLFNLNTAAITGGAVWNNQGNVAFTNGAFFDNQAAQNGGAIQNDTGRLSLFKTEIAQNQAPNGAGGGIRDRNGITQIIDSTVRNNYALIGGGIEATGSNLSMNNVVVEKNTAFGSGGGIELTNVNQFTFTTGQLIGNTAQNGGGLGSFQSTVDIRGVSITRNIATGFGGGLEGFESTFLLDNVNLSNNQAQVGGGLSNRSPSLGNLGQATITNSSTIANNQSTEEGGGIHSRNLPLTVTQSTIRDNIAGTQGGGIEATDSGNVQIQNTLIQNNRSLSLGGGGISLSGTTNLDLNQVVLRQNQSAANGGGLAAQAENAFSGAINIVDSVIDQNSAVANGGGVDVNPQFLADGTLTIDRSTFSNNFAGADGGAISIGTLAITTLNNVTIAQNRANRDGGGLNSSQGDFRLNNVTVANNQADANNDGIGRGGGIYALLPPTPTPAIQLNNTIVAANQAPTAPDVSGEFIDQGNNLIGINDSATGFSLSTLIGTSAAPIDPLLSPLGSYGGLTQTIALLPGSPAIDAGNSSLPADQRNVARVGAPDIGAFESRGFQIQPLGTPQNTPINTAFVTPLSLQVSSAFNEPIAGGQITFNAPINGASAVLSRTGKLTITANGTAQTLATANNLIGRYEVIAQGRGLPAVTYRLTNDPLPPPPAPPPPILPPPATVPPAPVPPAPATVPPAPAPTPAPSTPNVERFELTDRGQNMNARGSSTELTNLALASLDESFTQNYVQQFGGGVQSSKVTPQAVKSLLSDLDQERGLRSAIIYAIFVPKIFAETKNDARTNNDTGLIPNLLRAGQKRDDDRLELLFITAQGKLFRRSTPYQRRQISQQMSNFWLVNSDVSDPESFQSFRQQFYDWLFAPVAKDVESAKINGLVYVLDEGLRSVPISAMKSSRESLLKTYTISSIPSLGMLDRRKTILKNQTVLGMGADRFQSFNPLPAVPGELAILKQQGFMGETFLNESFTIANLVRQQQQRRPGILHLATHANFKSGKASESFIQFWDQPLTLDKVDQLKLRDSSLELLVLSACNTATGDSSAELGFSGIAALTGVRTAIGSLWSISDLGTFAFMSEFYHQLALTPSRADALRKTQLAMQAKVVRIEQGQIITSQARFPLPKALKNTADTTFSHPYFWSGFTMVGNPW